ncbi:semaphorin-5A-like isoform X1 [Limulus polyphemus]|uniref:Semaphorin-5A-like isoform X1 n=1 Tax=Limulus polyphemus TaxID=6850 RepID=A0ABM1SAA4_LIMPO|nr:semaphorin-5A-like isoform X1 [Limulus polyphemus]XP_022240556.1 semaphorin-5A-like isoform X1 [Limulus polyphemus]XP_022240559.1 semaphorin-5A-like isoform X1 [Limulus polyphemus]XP_022240565.1 semaphorin-5A-like isoform X1 [Limulus polyphemus]XP_022240573.1 semaphorin-5A-like isoform X1 [Limulus polyphemus]XP_022240580.1 semaphorin-5A-like isoform X1 [Limulus polyphemus]
MSRRYTLSLCSPNKDLKWIIAVLLVCQLLVLADLRHTTHVRDFRLIRYEDLVGSVDRFRPGGVTTFSQLLFDIPRYQLIVGARDSLYRLNLEELKQLEEVHLPSSETTITKCRQKGQSVENCRNFIKVLLSHNSKLFACGTNAFSPECYWRDINSIRNVIEKIPGEAKCPYSPHENSSALITVQGDYYIASALDFSARDSAIHRALGKGPFLRTVQYDARWLSEPDFVASYEIGNFTYFFFRESAVEHMNCGKIIFSRVGRICKNDQGGQFMLKDNWTTFLKARLNCSLPGEYPFYYNELQSIYYLEREQVFYATFTTPEISIYGSAICAFSMAAIHSAFNGPFKYQKSQESQWERHKGPHEHFQCETPGSSENILDADHLKLMDEAIQPSYSKPLYTTELERFNHIVVDVVPTKHYDDPAHVIFVSNNEGVIRKLVDVPQKFQICLVEEIHVFPQNSTNKILSLKLLKDTNSLYIGTDKEVLRVPLHRCERFLSETSCLNAMDPYCGWNEYQMACTTAPHRNPVSSFWKQEEIGCPRTHLPVNGGWGPWTSWFECEQIEKDVLRDLCLCRQRKCNSPTPANGGMKCEGMDFQVANCTQNGQWTEWSAWSACSQTCGLAVKTRRRTCGNPSPAYGGRICLGPEREEIYCTTNPPCPGPILPPVDGLWSDWSVWTECTALCGGGIQMRQRKCNSPAPKNGGRECLGCDHDYQQCNTHSCPEFRKTSKWTPWLQANKTKDGYFEQRFRFICNANVAQENLLRVGNMRSEERYCSEGGRNCFDAAFVNTERGWSEWSLWSVCSKSCGGGIQSKTRICNSEESDCDGESYKEKECNTLSCKGLEGWKEWSEWSLCDKNDEQHRQRTCKHSSDEPGQCQGSSEQTRMCIAGQFDYSTKASSQEVKGVSIPTVVGVCLGSFILGAALSALGTYMCMKRRYAFRDGRLSKKMIPVKQNHYITESELKNNMTPINGSPGKYPLREATIKRNGLRTPIHADQNF